LSGGCDHVAVSTNKSAQCAVTAESARKK
jgi:hypothetical protein